MNTWKVRITQLYYNMFTRNSEEKIKRGFFLVAAEVILLYLDKGRLLPLVDLEKYWRPSPECVSLENLSLSNGLIYKSIISSCSFFFYSPVFYNRHCSYELIGKSFLLSQRRMLGFWRYVHNSVIYLSIRIL